MVVAVVSQVLPLSMERTICAPVGLETWRHFFQLKSDLVLRRSDLFCQEKKVQTREPSSSWAMWGSRLSSSSSKRTVGADQVLPSSLERTMQMRPPLGKSSAARETCP